LDHYIAKGAINKKTGDTFVTNHAQKKTWSIQEIVSKYAGLSGKSISEFNEIFESKYRHNSTTFSLVNFAKLLIGIGCF
jgi:hypothetical protein